MCLKYFTNAALFKVFAVFVSTGSFVRRKRQNLREKNARLKVAVTD